MAAGAPSGHPLADGAGPAHMGGRSRAVTVRRLLALAIGMLLLPNLAVLAMHLVAQRSAAPPPVDVPIKNFTQVDDRLWRGAAPTTEGYRALAAGDPKRWRVVDASGSVQEVEALVVAALS